MSTVDVEEDFDLIEHLDFDPEIPCAAVKTPAPCTREADWMLTCRACGRGVGYCDEHLGKLRAMEQRLAAIPFMKFTCHGCGRQFRCIDEGVIITPVKAGA